MYKKEKQTLVPKRFYIGTIGVSAVNILSAISLIHYAIEKKQYGYICVTNVRTSVLSQKDTAFCNIQNNSLMTIPDGKPLTWYARLVGENEVERVAGPDLMGKVLSTSVEKGYSHYFYGSTEKVLKLMKENYLSKFEGVDIKGLYSPPFRPLTEKEKDETADIINSLKPTFVWVGLGAPKQEFWMNEMLPRIESSILVGVGAAFPFAAGTVKRPPEIFRKIGLEWLFRCIQMPITARRFIYPFFYFSLLLGKVYLLKLRRRIKKSVYD